MAELYLAEHDLTPNKSILLFESRKQYKDENIHTFQISMFGASYLAGVCARKCSEMTPLVLLANNTDSPINIAKEVLLQAMAATAMWSIWRMIGRDMCRLRSLTGK